MNKAQIKAIGTLAVALGALGLVFAITFGAIDPDALTGAVAGACHRHDRRRLVAQQQHDRGRPGRAEGAG